MYNTYFIKQDGRSDVKFYHSQNEHRVDSGLNFESSLSSDPSVSLKFTVGVLSMAEYFHMAFCFSPTFSKNMDLHSCHCAKEVSETISFQFQ